MLEHRIRNDLETKLDHQKWSAYALCEALKPVLKGHPCPAHIEVQGKSLLLWAQLPPKNGVGKHKQQKISLGLKSTPEGLRKALEIAITVQREVEEGTFRWKKYGRTSDATNDLADAVVKFEREFRSTPDAQVDLYATQTNWRCSYAPYFERTKRHQIERGLPFDSDLLVEVLGSYEPGSDSRRKCAICLKRLAKQEGIRLPENEEWKRVVGRKKQTERDKKYPTDAEILDLANRISDPAWRWVYGMIATYGLRTHEVFFCHTEDLLKPENEALSVRVKGDTKTGERSAYPLHRCWVDKFNLKDINVPSIEIDRPKNHISSTVSSHYRRREIGYVPYDFRHAWAIRAIDQGVQISVAARAMGHTVDMHTNTYQSRLDGRVMDREFNRVAGDTRTQQNPEG